MTTETDEQGNVTPLLAKLATRITPAALDRLKHKCDTIARTEAYPVPYGRVINQLIMNHLEPAPTEAPVSNGSRRVRKLAQPAA